MPVDDAKRALRETMLGSRAKVAARDGSAAASIAGRLVVLFRDRLAAGSPPLVVSGFWPIGDEIDVVPTLLRLGQLGATLALPVVVGRGEPLLFRRWLPGEALESAGFGTRVPSRASAELEPDVLLVPLLAADVTGNRLGYGAGYYDMTLRALRARKPVTAVGVAFDVQIVDMVPVIERDQRLDWVVTERRTIAVHRTG
jgi:5-formyltetrahydrofolate cyclo-ligase